MDARDAIVNALQECRIAYAGHTADVVLAALSAAGMTITDKVYREFPAVLSDPQEAK